MDLRTLFGTQSGAIVATCVGLAIFGYGFNALVTYLSRRGLSEGYTWLLVVAGVAVTVLAAGFTIGWGNVILLTIYFVCDGFFMAAGDIWRHVKARAAENHVDDESA